jgi:hypothetical protein
MQLARIGTILMVPGILPLQFLLYSFLNLKKLSITIIHPRVNVETGCFLLLLLFRLLLWLTP